MSGKMVAFTRMKDGTTEEYRLLNELEDEFMASTADRVLEHLLGLADGLSGYQVTRLEHALQCATRAWRDGADEEMTVAALLHDIGDHLSTANHGEMAAAVLRPFVSDRTYWILKYHGVFQGYYFFHHLGGDRHARDRYKDSEHYQACVDFCEKWDQCSFDPEYDWLPLTHFEPMVRRIFARAPFGPNTTSGIGLTERSDSQSKEDLREVQ